MRMGKKIRSKEIKERVKERLRGKVDLQLGKNGLTSGFINEVKSRLEKHKVVKLRVLKSFRATYTGSIDELATLLANETGSRVYEVRGFTITLIKEK
ncbi:MAG: YhbY family RNA-binding protein [Desulfurococcaceae archaeon]